MKWLLPLGFLGLLGLIVLLIIYLIKPNFQKKAVSSTYVWKLSLKFRKKRNPLNRLQDMLLLICQILTITACALVMAQPVLAAFRPAPVTQKIAIIDGSVSMLAISGSETRFDYAVQQIRDLAKTVTDDNGEITVIVAGEQAEYVTMRTTARTLPELNAALDNLVATNACCYSGADVEGAMHLAEQVLNQTPQADVLYYTAKNYIDKGDVEVVDVSDSGDYNVAILNSVPILIENYYTFSVDVASYGRDADIMLYCEVYGINGNDSAVAKYQLPVWLSGDVAQNVQFNAETTGSEGIFSYRYAYIYISENDSFGYDNMFYIYGGTKEKIRIQYASSVPNIFFRGSIMSLRSTLRSRWDIEFVEINVANKEPATEGFDYYIFECTTPKALPSDGVVMLVNVPEMPAGIGVTLTDTVRTGNMFLSATGDHPITNGIDARNILVTACTTMRLSENYDVLMTCYRAEPAYAVRNDDEYKLIVMAFEVQNSDATLLLEFPKLFFNTYDYFFPSTVTKNNFEVGESVLLNARAPSLTVRGPGEEIILNELPGSVTLSTVGTYSLSQTLFTGKTIVENIYVKIPNVESDFTASIEELVNPYVEVIPEAEDYDLLLYFAGALVLLLFAEWWLSSRMQ